MMSFLFLSMIIVLSTIIVSAMPPIDVIVSVRGKKYEINAETVAEVLSKIETMANLESGQQNVLYRGKVLNQDDNLEDFGISNGDILNVVKRRVQRVNADEPENSSDESVSTSIPNSFGTDNMKNLPSQMNPEEMKKAMEAMDKLLDSNVLDEFFNDEEKMENARLSILENSDEYEKMMPGFKEQAKDIASDPVKWKDAMQKAKLQMEQLKSQRDSFRNQNPNYSKLFDSNRYVV